MVFGFGVMFCFWGFVWHCNAGFFLCGPSQIPLKLPLCYFCQESLSLSPNCSSEICFRLQNYLLHKMCASLLCCVPFVFTSICFWQLDVSVSQLHMRQRLGCSVGAWWAPDGWIYRLWICECSSRDQGPTAIIAQKHWGEILICDPAYLSL